MTHSNFIDTCIKEVEKYVDKLKGGTEVFVVWTCKTLQNSKCVLAENKTQLLYEFTMNGDTKEIYVNIYKKEDNYTINI